MGIEYQPFSDFVPVVQQLVAPEDLGENLVPFFRDQVAGALSDIQTMIPWVRSFNLNVYTKADVSEFCAASTFTGPVGKLTQLFAYKPGAECKKFYYKRVTPAAIDCWIEHQRCAACLPTVPPSTNIYDSPYCNYVVLGTTACAPPYLTATEDDCKFRSLDDDCRIFAIGPDYKVYAAPRFPCDYQLFLQWQGIQRKWSDTTAVPVDQQLREAVVARVEMRTAMKERDFVAAREYEKAYSMALRVLNFRYHDEQDPELKRDCTAALEQQLPAAWPMYSTSQIVA